MVGVPGRWSGVRSCRSSEGALLGGFCSSREALWAGLALYDDGGTMGSLNLVTCGQRWVRGDMGVGT